MEWTTRCEHICGDLGDVQAFIERNTSVLLDCFSSVYAF